jgi:predicted dehydrogenase
VRNQAAAVHTPLRLGLVGCGRAAERYYVPAFAGLREARLVAVADPLPERRRLIASSIPGCVGFSSADALLQRGTVDAVIVATPPATHTVVATLALRAGLPVLVEKPLAPSLEEVRQLERVAACSTGSLMVGFTRRYWDPVRKLRAQLASRHVNSATVHCMICSNVDAWAPISGRVDVLEDLGPHQFDTLRYIFDREISAIRARWLDPDTIKMRLELGAEVVAECQAGYAQRSSESIHLRCGGRAYRMHADSERITPAAGQLRWILDLSDAVQRRLRRVTTSIHRSFEQQLASFCDYARSATIPEPGIAAGLAVTRAIEAARRSAANGGAEVSF